MVGLYPRLVWQLLTLCILNPSWVHIPPMQLYPFLKAYNLKQHQIMFHLTIHLTCYHSETSRTYGIKIHINSKVTSMLQHLCKYCLAICPSGNAHFTNKNKFTVKRMWLVHGQVNTAFQKLTHYTVFTFSLMRWEFKFHCLFYEKCIWTEDNEIMK